MSMSPAEINKFGLALPPSNIDCLGEDCSITYKKGQCFADRHHLYFYKDRYNVQGPKSLAYRLRQDPFNIIWIARCRHDEIHRNFDGPYIPGDDVIEAFLDESSLLRDLGVSAVRLASLELDLDCDNKFKPYSEKDSRMQNLSEQIEFQRERISTLGELVTIMEVVPPEFISNPIRAAYNNAPSRVLESANQHLADFTSVAA